MSFFDERVEAYRRYVGNARDDVDAARGRYEMACDDAAAELINVRWSRVDDLLAGG